MRRRTSSSSSSSSDERARVGSVADAERREDVYLFHVRHAESYKWFNGKKKETAGEVICKKCYHKELVDLSDRICAVRAHRVPFFDFGRTFRARCERQSRALFAVLTNENRFFCIHVYNRRAVLQKLRDAGTDRKKTTRSVCAKKCYKKEAGDDGQDVQSVSDKEEQSVDAFENDPGSGFVHAVLQERD